MDFKVLQHFGLSIVTVLLKCIMATVIFRRSFVILNIFFLTFEFFVDFQVLHDIALSIVVIEI